MKTQRAIIYARVSTERQEDNTSLNAQVEACSQYAAKHGYVVVDIFRETFSGEFIFARPEFQRALRLIEVDSIQHMIVDVPDRLGRGNAIPVIEYTLGNKGVQVHYVTGRLAPDADPIAVIAQHSVDVLVSGLERLKIRERTVRGREKTVQNGKIMSSHRPYGYSIVDAKLEILEEEAQVVRQMYEWYVIDQLSLHEVVKRLHANGILTPNERKGKPSKFGTCSWSPYTVHQILRSETYAGVWHYNKVHDVRKERGTSLVRQVTQRPKNERIPVPVPAIVPRGWWEAAQRRFAKNRKQWTGRPSDAGYWLRGFVFCTCGRRMSATGIEKAKRQNKSEWRYFLCTSAHGVIGENRCLNRALLKMDTVEREAWEYIEHLLLTPESLLQGYESRREEALSETQVTRTQIAALNREMSSLEQKLNLLLELYLHGDLDREEYAAKKRELERKREELDQDRHEKEISVQDAVVTDITAQEIQVFCSKVSEGIQLCTNEDKRNILKLLEVTVVFDGESLTIGGGVPVRKLSMSSLPQCPR